MAAAFLLMPLTSAVASAEATAPRKQGCVTYAEYKKVKSGMTVAKVAKLFGTKGKQSAKSEAYGITVEIRTYNGCTQFGVVSVLFTNGRLDTKSQAGL